MNEIFQILIGAVVLILGIPIGNLLRKYTTDELKIGKKWFKLLTYIGIVGGFVGLIINNDTIMFTLFFIAIVSSRSLIVK
jgi:hypothetical protein